MNQPQKLARARWRYVRRNAVESLQSCVAEDFITCDSSLIDTSRDEKTAMNPDIAHYIASLAQPDKKICDLLAGEIDQQLPEAESKIWHAHPVWFLGGNPVVGYGKLKDCIRLLFWSGQSFEEEALSPVGKFKAAEARFTEAEQVDKKLLKRWLVKARKIQWDCKNIFSSDRRIRRSKSE